MAEEELMKKNLIAEKEEKIKQQKEKIKQQEEELANKMVTEYQNMVDKTKIENGQSEISLEIIDLMTELKKDGSEGSVASLLMLAIKELGYSEDDKEKTKFPSEIAKYDEDFYVIHDEKYPWCDMFVDWLFIKNYGLDTARKMLEQSEKRKRGSSTEYSKIYYTNYTTSNVNIKPGQQIFFKNNEGIVVHTGIVCGADSEYVYVIEGNTLPITGTGLNADKCVALKRYKKDDPRIDGFGLPLYDDKNKDLKNANYEIILQSLRKICEKTEQKMSKYKMELEKIDKDKEEKKELEKEKKELEYNLGSVTYKIFNPISEKLTTSVQGLKKAFNHYIKPDLVVKIEDYNLAGLFGK